MGAAALVRRQGAHHAHRDGRGAEHRGARPPRAFMRGSLRSNTRASRRATRSKRQRQEIVYLSSKGKAHGRRSAAAADAAAAAAATTSIANIANTASIADERRRGG